MGFSYSNSCDLFGLNYCEVIQNCYRSSNNNVNNDGNLDTIIELLNKEMHECLNKNS